MCLKNPARAFRISVDTTTLKSWKRLLVSLARFLNTLSQLVVYLFARRCHLGGKIRPLRCTKVLVTTSVSNVFARVQRMNRRGGVGKKESLDSFQGPGVCVWEVIITGCKADFYWAGFSGGLKAPLHPFPGGSWLFIARIAWHSQTWLNGTSAPRFTCCQLKRVTNENRWQNRSA